MEIKENLEYLSVICILFSIFLPLLYQIGIINLDGILISLIISFILISYFFWSLFQRPKDEKNSRHLIFAKTFVALIDIIFAAIIIMILWKYYLNAFIPPSPLDRGFVE